MTGMEYGVVCKNKPGRSVSGDTFFFHQDQNSTLVALIDGLGAGPEAHTAAVRARDCIAANPDAPLTELLKQCHDALRGTRGAVMMLMRIDRDQERVSFAGVGNIGVRVFSDTPIKPLSRNGIVGYRLPNVREFSYPYTPGDVFILHSDGISSHFTVDERWVRDPRADLQEIAQEIADKFAKEDDVTILVVR